MITFPVSDVPEESSRLHRASVAKTLMSGRPGRLEAAIKLADGLVPTEEHGFLGAARHAFSEHLPLRIRPDDVWLLIVQGLAKHVELHAESLRERLVAHEGQVTLTIDRDGFVLGADDNDWSSVFPEFREAIRKHVGARHDLIVGEFSTTEPLDRLLGSIALMDVMQSYFGYVVRTRCGIPRITLDGTPEDWASIRARARVLAEFDLGWWCEPLEVALTHFVDAAEGRADPEVWRSFYKWHDGSGGPHISGWVNALFPYIRRTAYKQPDEQVRNPYAQQWDRDSWGGGPSSSDFPGGMRAVPAVWDYLGTRIPMQFLGGFVGAQQDADGTLAPQLGWAVLDVSQT